MKNILITGPSTGFVLQLAIKLHKKDFNVIGTSRDPERNFRKTNY